jgi:hypothetical protein
VIEPVGATEIGQRASVARATVEQWVRRHEDFPAARWQVGGRPAYEWGEVQEWLARTGRIGGLQAMDAEGRIPGIASVRTSDLLRDRDLYVGSQWRDIGDWDTITRIEATETGGVAVWGTSHYNPAPVKYKADGYVGVRSPVA